MRYKYSYQSKFEKKKIKDLIASVFSNVLYGLYRNKHFKKWKLDRNEFLKHYARRPRVRKFPDNINKKIPKNPDIDLYSITFFDCFQFEDISKIKVRLIKTLSNFNGGNFKENPDKINEIFDGKSSSYDNVSWGSILYNDTKNNKELDLIDGISYAFIKSKSSHFILTYKVYPSSKFKKLFKGSLKKKTVLKSKILFNSIKGIFRDKRIVSTIQDKPIYTKYWIDKVMNEINYQFKSIIGKSIKFGYFNSKKDILFPSLVVLKYEPEKVKSYQNELFSLFSIGNHHLYNDGNITFTIKESNYSKKHPNRLELFVPDYDTDDGKIDLNKNIDYMTNQHISAVAPHWMLINLASLHKENIVLLREKISIYFKKKRAALFLENILNFNSKLLFEWVNFERLRKSWSLKIFKNHLYHSGIANEAKNVENGDFNHNLQQYSDNVSKDIKNSYEELIDVFKHISEDNVIRANMRLQRILFGIALLGIVLTIYGTNSKWFNSWINSMLFS